MSGSVLGSYLPDDLLPAYRDAAGKWRWGTTPRGAPIVPAADPAGTSPPPQPGHVPGSFLCQGQK